MIRDGVAHANTLTARWAAATDGEPTVLSGAGVWPLLAYLSSAADGVERAELEQAVGMPAASAVDAATELLGLLRSAVGTHAALGLWVHRLLTLHDAWLRTVPADTVEVLAGGDAVDAWVRKHTDGLLDGTSVPIDPDTLLVLATVLTVRTQWREPFLDGSLGIEDGPWAERQFAWLHRWTEDRDRLAVYETVHGQVTVLSVDGVSDITVDLVLGEPDVPAGTVLATAIAAPGAGGPCRLGSQLTVADAPGLRMVSQDAAAKPRLYASVPRFTVSRAHDLLAVGEVFGLCSVARADRQRLPRMSDTPLAVGRACQELTASFTAEGFVAAVSTRFEIALAGGRPTQWRDDVAIGFDRPFGFVVRHRPSGLVLLAGWVTEPDPPLPVREFSRGEDHDF
ncbi:serpin family protein [Catellatospora citrea]|uniref:serpin family protein n=1 Tax=Catellatospora citrea TaxID=53366 RepID=UPI0014772099|nr:serpin family protein [Catellatospora citrea]